MCVNTARIAQIIALFGFLGGGLIAIVGGLNAYKISGSKASIGIAVTVYALLALVSILGLIGAAGRKLALIRIYFLVLLAHLFFSLATGIYAIFRIFKEGSIFLDDCMASDSAANVEDPKKMCTDGLKLIKGVTVTLFIIFWLVEIWGCVIVNSYGGQLQDENAVEGVVKDTEAW
ncbi:hypothetical protein DXG03_003862 [Asterophora parasitica]|uniref:Uncharacterized protein n=1 Tax=Asterophora parasitica TaxID=117018 RepID=A0A9P7GAI7_9AGAR|nr:hypothetical protein DXG03_003862 [Asterophora parasitica]